MEIYELLQAYREILELAAHWRRKYNTLSPLEKDVLERLEAWEVNLVDMASIFEAMKEEIDLLKKDSAFLLQMEQSNEEDVQRQETFNTALGFGMGMEITGALDFLSSVKQSKEVIEAEHNINEPYHTDFSNTEDIEELSMDELDLL